MAVMNDTVAGVDPRRALGRRPGAQPPRLFLEESPLEPFSPPLSLPAPPSPRTRHVSLAIPSPSAVGLSSPTSPSSPNFSGVRKFRRPTINRSKQPKTSAKGLYETQKLLSHLLDRLEDRDTAPDLLSRATVAAREACGVKHGKGKGKAVNVGQVVAAAAHTGLSAAQGNTRHGQSSLGIGSDDLAEGITLKQGEWDTDTTYDLVEQTRGLLVLAARQDLELFSSTGEDSLPSPMKSKRKAGRFSSFASPIATGKASFDNDEPLMRTDSAASISGQSLLHRLLSALSTLINVDCLHRTHLFRLLRPPNALQAACLDIATFLFHNCAVPIRVQIVELVVGGLYTMGLDMGERICEWLEGRFEDLLVKLSEERGCPQKGDNPAWQDPFVRTNEHDVSVPTFSISADQTDPALPAVSPGWLRYSPVNSSSPSFPFPTHMRIRGLLSTHSASVELSAMSLHMASLASRLLLALVSTMDLFTSKLTTLHRFHRLLSLVLTAKPDASLDLLEIIGHASGGPRRTAVELLSTFYSEVMGHNTITRRPASLTYESLRTKWETGQDQSLREDLVDDHHFIPWRISSREASGSAATACGVCNSDIHGFCIRCTLCQDVRHLHCQGHDNNAFHYNVVTLSSRNSAPTAVSVKFGLCLPRLNDKILDNGSKSNDGHPTKKRIGQHDLHLVNLFTTTLCDECHLPLWGLSCQGYACVAGCQRFFHKDCSARLGTRERGACNYGADVVVDEIAAHGRDPFSVPQSSVSSSFEREMKAICFSATELMLKSYDEIATAYGAIWTQYQLLKNGLASGSIRPISTTEHTLESDFLKLRPFLKLYEEHLHTHDTDVSNAAADFVHVANSGQCLGQGYLFSERYLSYVTALLRTPSAAASLTAPTPPGGFLTANGMPDQPREQDQSDPVYETLELSVVLRGLAADLNIQDPKLASIFINHLLSVGLISIVSHSALSLQDVLQGKLWCSFSFPLLIDSSPSVEMLILSIEVLLDDLDLTMNEIALRLLRTRAWPSLLCSPYALERLCGALVAWIMAQDENLHEIVKQYARKHRRLPGVRAGTKGNSSVQIYKDDRVALQASYARPWLEALHQQEPALYDKKYAHIVYEQCKTPTGVTSQQGVSQDEAASQIAGKALERMTVMVDADCIFSVQLDLLTAWLEDLGSLASKDLIYKGLPRLLRPTLNREQQPIKQPDIWELSQLTSVEGPEGLTRVCKWMRVLSFSGVEIPWPTLVSLIDIQTSTPSSIDARLDLVIAVNANSAHLDHAEFVSMCCKMFVNYAESMETPPPAEQAEVALDLLRRSMILILRAYGVSLDDVLGTRLEPDDLQTKQPASMSKRRRMTTSPLLLSMDDAMISAVGSIVERKLFPTELLLDFLWLLFTKSTSAANIDGFLHRNAASLFPILWGLIQSPVDRRSRARVFLRLLAVNSHPVEEIIKEEFHHGNRTCLKEKLLVFVLELVDESLTYENISWRRASVGLIVLFFQALLDAKDVNPDNLVIIKTLLPYQLKAVSGCFEEYLVQSSDENRLNLIARLQHLRLVNPKWPVLSWTSIEDLLAETVTTIAHLATTSSVQTMSALSDARSLQANLIAIGLELLAEGQDIEWVTAQRFQQHVAGACVTPWPSPFEGITSLILPALRSVLDSSHYLNIGTQVVDPKSRKSALIGALFVPVVIDFGRELRTQDLLTQRTILDLIMLVFFKQNTRLVELAALAALQSVADYVLASECVETRLLGIQILQTAASRVERESFARAVPSVFEIMARNLVKETENNGDSVTIEQTKIFLRTVVRIFGKSRLFVQLLKQNAIDTDPSIDRTALGKALQLIHRAEPSELSGSLQSSVIDLAISDLPDVLKRGRQTMEQALESFDRIASNFTTKLSEETTMEYGMFINRLSKHVAEWDVAEFDPNPMLSSCASILVLVPPTASTTLLHQISTFLHFCITRFIVRSKEVTSLLEVSEGIAMSQSTENTLRTVLFELSGSTLHGSHVAPTTFDTLLTFLHQHAFPKNQGGDVQISSEESRVLQGSATGCVNTLLRRHPTIAAGGINTEILLSILLQVSALLMKADISSPGSLGVRLSALSGEAATTQLGVFTYLLLASLDLPKTSARSRVLGLYPLIGRAASLCLRASADLLSVQDAAGEGAESLSAVFAVFRLALLAVSSASTEVAPDVVLAEEVVSRLWDRLWPDWYRLLSLSVENKCVNGPLRTVAHSTFLDTLIFLGTIKSPLISAHAGTLAHSLRVMRRHQGTSSHGGSKMIKAELVLRTEGLTIGMLDEQSLVKTIQSDLIAAEKLRALRHQSI